MVGTNCYAPAEVVTALRAYCRQFPVLGPRPQLMGGTNCTSGIDVNEFNAWRLKAVHQLLGQ